MVTLHDVARKAGVTAATVSNVIRNKGVVGEATRQRVLSAIEELGYRPNLMARGLVEGKSYTLALIVEDISNPFYAEIALEIERRAREKGYHVLLCNSLGDMEIAKTYLDKMHGGWVDGLITVAAMMLEDIMALAERGLPLVLCGWSESSPLPELPTVNSDTRLAGYLAGQHLTALGHRRIASIVSGSALPNELNHPKRLEGLAQALAEASLELPEAYLKLGHGTTESGYSLARELLALDEKPSAIFATNDLMAIGVLEAAKDMGLHVPDELSVVGVDDIALSAHVRPSLTTIALPKKRMAEAIMASLLSQLEHRKLTEQHIWVEPYLVTRQSTAAPRGSAASPRKPRDEP